MSTQFQPMLPPRQSFDAYPRHDQRAHEAGFVAHAVWGLALLAAAISVAIGIWFIRPTCTPAITVLSNCVNYTEGALNVTFGELIDFNLMKGINSGSSKYHKLKPSERAVFIESIKAKQVKKIGTETLSSGSVGNLKGEPFDSEIQFSRVGRQVTLSVPYAEIDTTGSVCVSGYYAANPLPSNLLPDLSDDGACTQIVNAGTFTGDNFYANICLASGDYNFFIYFDDCYLNETLVMPGFSMTYTGA